MATIDNSVDIVFIRNVNGKFINVLHRINFINFTLHENNLRLKMQISKLKIYITHNCWKVLGQFTSPNQYYNDQTSQFKLIFCL